MKKALLIRHVVRVYISKVNYSQVSAETNIYCGKVGSFLNP